MFDIQEELKKLPKMELWSLRAKAVNEEITLQELGRLLLAKEESKLYSTSNKR